jgi:hypothetical protein
VDNQKIIAGTAENVSRSGSGKVFFDDFNRANL